MKKTFLLIISILCLLQAHASDGEVWLQRARQGDVKAMYQTALRYSEGLDGLPKSVEKARYWAEKGAKLGNTDCMLLAATTYNDLRTARFESMQLAWNSKAGEAGSIDGAFQARNNMLILKYECETENDKRRALEGQIYWNEKMLANPLISTSEYASACKQSLQIRDMLQKELEQFNHKDSGKPRVVENPQLSYINPGTKLERVLIQPDGTTLEMSFVNNSGLKQWNINRDAYITCDVTPDKKYRLLRTRGVNISPKPTEISGNRGERISFSITFEPIPLHSGNITLVEGPSRDNFHAENVDIKEPETEATRDSQQTLKISDPTTAPKSKYLAEEESPGSYGQVEAFDTADVAPSFPGGSGAMMKWIGQNLKYPESAQLKNIQGKVLVKIMVLSDGTIGEIQIARSVDPALDNEAVRLIKAMPKWNPGSTGGKAVNVWYTLPIIFRLN